MRRRTTILVVSVATSTALLASTATAARPPEPRPGSVSVRVLRAPVLPNRRINALAAARHNVLIAMREARGLTTNPGRRGNDTAPHTEPTG
jgi:hypothetical protein